MLVITAIGIMVPAAPGYIGTLHVACKVGLALFQVGSERSVLVRVVFLGGAMDPGHPGGSDLPFAAKASSLRTLGRAGEEQA